MRWLIFRWVAPLRFSLPHPCVDSCSAESPLFNFSLPSMCWLIIRGVTPLRFFFAIHAWTHVPLSRPTSIFLCHLSVGSCSAKSSPCVDLCSAETPLFHFSLPSMRGLMFRCVATLRFFDFCCHLCVDSCSADSPPIILLFSSIPLQASLHFSEQVAYVLCLQACGTSWAKTTSTCIIGFLKVI